jgi:hypothetical protein
MAAITYNVDVYRLQLARMYQSGGEAYRWLDKVRLAMHRACERNAPDRTGGLRRAHRSNIRGRNQYLAHAEVINDAEHASFVHLGTSGSVAPEDWLYLSPGGPGRNTVSPYAGQSFSKKRLRHVAGQAPNPWMDEACSRIARRQGGITIG